MNARTRAASSPATACQENAYLLLRTDDLTGIACNDRFKEVSLTPELIGDGVAGRHLTEFAPLLGIAHLRMYRKVAQKGGVETGVDHLVGPDGLSHAYRWRITRPTHEVVALVIECEGSR